MSKKILIALLIIFGLGIVGLTMAHEDKNDFEPKANISDVAPIYLKQKILIEETSEGNMILIKAAKVTEISSTGGSTTPNLLKVKIFGQDYKIDILADTNVVRHNWGKSEVNLSEFSVGDIVNAYGTLDATDSFLIHAKTVRDVSIQKKHAVLNGTIQSINSSDKSFVLQTEKKGPVTVTTDTNTKIYQGKVEKTFSDLQTGLKVLVRGIWDTTLSKVQALLIRIKPMEVED